MKVVQRLRESAAQLKPQITALFLAMKRGDTPLSAKILAALTIAYALSPIDLIPDFIPVLGYLDDLILLPCMIALCIKLIPPEIMAQCRREAQTVWQDGKPKRWYYALPILAIWLVLIYLILRAVLR